MTSTSTTTVVSDPPPPGVQASTTPSPPSPPPPPTEEPPKRGFLARLGLGDLLGPIGLTIGGGKQRKEVRRGVWSVGRACVGVRVRARKLASSEQRRATRARAADAPTLISPHHPLYQQKPAGLGLGTLDNMLGPIGLTVGTSSDGPAVAQAAAAAATEAASPTTPTPTPTPSPSTIPIRNTLSTAEWRARYEADGCVDLWVEEEFNAGSRLVGGRAAHWGGVPGAGSGEGRTGDPAAPTHAIRILNPNTGQDIVVAIPADRYILHEAEDQGLLLPYACRMGCCTACAVRVTEADGSPSSSSSSSPALLQPESLGIAAELRARGFALMCVARPTRAVTLTVADEDEVYDLQFGDAFAARATDPDGPGVERDDFALEIANMDE